MRLNQKTILITGGTSGIGFELARQLLALGNTVIVTGRDKEKLEVAKNTLAGIHVFQSDVADPKAIKTLCRDVLVQFRELDVLINNAGIMRNLKMQDGRSLTDVTREIDINLSGPVQMVQQFLPHLQTRTEAVIINVSSGLAFIPFPLSPVYSAAKAGMHAFSQALRVQLRGTNVVVIDRAHWARARPISAKRQPCLYTGETIFKYLAGGAAIDVLFRYVDKVMLAKPAGGSGARSHWSRQGHRYPRLFGCQDSLSRKISAVRHYIELFQSKNCFGSRCHNAKLSSVGSDIRDLVRDDQMVISLNRHLDVVANDTRAPPAGGHRTSVRVSQ